MTVRAVIPDGTVPGNEPVPGTTETDPAPGSVSFVERITKMVVAYSIASVLVIAGLVAFFLKIPLTDQMNLAWWLGLGFLFGGTAIAAAVAALKK